MKMMKRAVTSASCFGMSAVQYHEKRRKCCPLLGLFMEGFQVTVNLSYPSKEGSMLTNEHNYNAENT